jgi:hypothetical protein
MEGLDAQQRLRLVEAQLDDCSHPSERHPVAPHDSSGPREAMTLALGRG